jgi:hypothetical protein
MPDNSMRTVDKRKKAEASRAFRSTFPFPTAAGARLCRAVDRGKPGQTACCAWKYPDWGELAKSRMLFQGVARAAALFTRPRDLSPAGRPRAAGIAARHDHA